MNRFSPRSDAHLIEPSFDKPGRHQPCEPDNVPFVRNASIALLEEHDYYNRLIDEYGVMDEDDKARYAYLCKRLGK